MRPLIYPFLVVAALAQAPPNATFRTGITEVLVDATVFDKKGTFRGDLTRDQFHLFEDGKEQKITSFTLAGTSAVSGRSPHFIALVFEHEDPGEREEVSRFVGQSAAPELYFAVFSRINTEMRLVAPFTNDPMRIQAALKSMQIAPPMPIINGKMEIFANQSRARSPFLDRVVGVADEMASIHGRKVLFLFTYGLFGLGSEQATLGNSGDARTTISTMALPMREAMDECNADNIAVYSFVNVSRKAMPPTDFIASLALGTGGEYVPYGDYDLSSYLGRIAASQSDYYLLGYAPAPESAAKPCHKLKVKVDRSGLEVNTRDTYCSSDRPPERPLKSGERALESMPTAGLPAPGMQLSWFYSKPGSAIVDLAMDLAPHGKQFNLLGIAYREDGSVATRLGDTVKVDANATSPYHYSRQFNLPPGRYRIRVTVGSGGEPFGAAEKTIEIAPWDGGTLSASGLALGVTAARITDVTAALSNSMLDGPHRMASQGWEVTPMGASEFHTGTKGMLYFEIYAAQDGVPLAPRMRIVDRTTGEEQTDSGLMDIHDFIHQGDPLVPIALTLPVSKLSEGSYRLEVRVGDTILRTADFEIK